MSTGFINHTGNDPDAEIKALRAELDQAHARIARLTALWDHWTVEAQRLEAEIERLRREYPYSDLDMEMHVEAVTKELRARIERLEVTLTEIAENSHDVSACMCARAALTRKEGP